jgi:hypothetical protein
MFKHSQPPEQRHGQNPSAARLWKSSASAAAAAAVAVTRTQAEARVAAVVAAVQELRLSSTRRQTFLQPLR